MTRIGLWTRRALYSTISGIILTILMPTPAAMVSDDMRGLPGAAFEYSFGVVERDGAFWCIERMSNAYFTDIHAEPFATREQAEAWRTRSRALLERILRSGGGMPGSRIETEFTLPAWELATKTHLKPFDGPLPGKGADLPSAFCRGVGVPVHYACWLETSVPNPGRPTSRSHRGTLKWFPLPHATLIYWPGFLFDVLVWSTASFCVGWLCRVAVRRLRKAKPQPSTPN